jgi:CHAT domain-containing protein
MSAGMSRLAMGLFRLSVLPVLLAVVVLSAATARSSGGEADDASLSRYRAALDRGTVSNNLGRYGEAESAFREAWEACLALHGDAAPVCGDALVRVAMEVSNQRRFDEATLLFDRAEPLTRAAPSPLAYPRFLTYRAMDRANRGDYEAAYALAVEANASRRSLLQSGGGEAEALLADLAHGLFVQATLALERDEAGEATVLAHLSRRLIRRSSLLPDWWVAHVDELLARVDHRNGDVRQAERRLQMALQTRRYALGEARPVALAHLSLGALYADSERGSEALRAARPGLAILEDDPTAGPGLEADQVLPFLLAGEAQRGGAGGDADGLGNEMFAAGQLVRGSMTAQTIARTAARLAAGDSAVADLIDRAQRAADRRDGLRLELGRLAVAAGEEADGGAMARVRGEYAAAVRRAAALDAELRAAFPAYERLVAAAPVDLEAIRALLEPGEGLAYFVVGARRGFVFLIRPDGVATATVPLGLGDLAERVARLRAPLERAGSRVRPFDMAAAHELHQALFGRLGPDLAAVDHLVVVPSGPLLSLPFALLVGDRPAGLGPTDYGRAGWLVRDMAVTTVPSVQAFADLRRVPPSAAPRPIVGFGDPAFAGDADGSGLAALARHCRADAAAPPELLRALAPLPGTATEVRRTAAALGAGAGAVHLGAGASETAVRSLPLDQYRIVYFATHGLLPGELRCRTEPGLALSPPAGPAAERGADGLLEASEIALLRLDADLVVLSACNTAGGDGGFGGEALSGLARAFFQAGARSLLVSHWQVDSVATTRLMTALFGHRAVGDTPEALRRAQLAMLAEPATAHPYFWAAFTLVGGGT